MLKVKVEVKEKQEEKRCYTVVDMCLTPSPLLNPEMLKRRH